MLHGKNPSLKTIRLTLTALLTIAALITPIFPHSTHSNGAGYFSEHPRFAEETCSAAAAARRERQR